jgi:uncharacterized protein
MKKRTLGKTGLQVSELGFGGIPISRMSLEEAADLIRLAHGLGLNFFDTANMYLDSEQKMGQALAPVRDGVVIATKTAARDVPTAKEHLAQSLRDLQTDWIDLYQAHNVSTEEDLEKVLAPDGVYEFMAEARDKGQIRHIGLSSHHPDIALKAVETGLFETLQYPFNFLETGALDELFPAAEKLGLGLIGMKPLGGGLLEKAGLCFGFLQKYPHLIPIPGIQTREELEEIVDLYENPRPLSRADLETMESIKADLGDNFCRRCGYCMPCPQGIEIPFVLLLKSQVKRFSPTQVTTMNRARMALAEECEECGQCLEKCPYQLPIPDLLKDTVEYFRAFTKRHGTA